MTNWRDFWIGTFFALICLTWLASMVIAEYHNEEPSETICETFEELKGINNDISN